MRKITNKHQNGQWNAVGHGAHQDRSKPLAIAIFFVPWCILPVFCGNAWAAEGNWLQWGGSSHRNNLSSARGLPDAWSIGQYDADSGRWNRESAKNIAWVARLGSQSYGTPVLAGNLVLCAGNNGVGYLPRYPKHIDLGCLFAFDRRDGRFVWQLSREKHPLGNAVDWELQGICSVPLVEGDRLWIVSNLGEVLCLDLEGFLDGENDGPFRDEPNANPNEADIVWRFDMMKSLGSVQHNMASCSVTALGDLLLVCTSNGIDEEHKRLPAPEAPAFIALDKHTGEVIWTDRSPNPGILHGQWGSPAAAVLGGVPQAIFPGGDGWLYSFRAERTAHGKPELLWKFDCNPKTALYKPGGRGDRCEIVATPVVADGKVFIAIGQDPEYGEGPGRLWCIDPTKRGDVSPELVVDASGRPVPHRREKAVDPARDEKVVPNPNSAAVWCYTGQDLNGNGTLEFEETMHRSLSKVVVAEGLVFAADIAGAVHCLDARDGRLLWSHDLMAAVWGSPLAADGRFFIGDEDGKITVFSIARTKRLVSENDMGASVYSTPVAVGDTLYIATRSHLAAVRKGDASSAGAAQP